MKAGLLVLVSSFLLTSGCSSSQPPRGTAPAEPDAASGGAGGGTGGSPGGGTGGSPGSAGEGGSGGGGADSAAGSGGAGPVEAGTAVGGNAMDWYEAEAIPPNQLTGSTLTVNPPKPRPAKCTPCTSIPIKPGDSCCSGGGQITWLTQGIGPIPGGLTFNNVSVPSDGMYDVTWWYHCGNNDNFGDKHCGGQTNPPTTPSGCRPHQIVVNGTEMTGTYHFPCFSGAFLIIRAATTQLPLKAGMNSIKVYPKQRDSADMDALAVHPAGQGTPPLIMSNSVLGAN